MVAVGCAYLWPPAWPALPVDALDVPTSGYLGVVEISVIDQYFWRDFMPGWHPDRGEDGGSPLYVNVHVRFCNLASWDEYLFIRSAYIRCDGRDYPVTLKDINGSPPWDGTVPGDSTIIVQLMTHEGPYVPVSSEVVVVITFETLWGGELTVRTEFDEVHATM